MKYLFSLLALLSIGLTSAQDLKTTHGKTNAQILKMGYQAWYDFYTGKEGEGTYGMSGATGLYADAVGWRNDGLIAKLPVSRRQGMKDLRKQLEKFGENLLKTGTALTGGGTVWNIHAASMSLNLEEALYGVLGGKVKAAPSLTTSKITKGLDDLDKSLAAMAEDEFSGIYKKADALKAVANAKLTFKSIAKSASKLDRKASDRVLDICQGWIELAS